MAMLRAISIDDDLESQALLKQIAEKTDIELVPFTDLQEAIHYMDGHEVDILFIDFMLPVIGGVDIVQHMRRYHPSVFLFIMVSVISDKALVEEIFLLHNMGLLVKPLCIDGSVEKIRRCLEEI